MRCLYQGRGRAVVFLNELESERWRNGSAEEMAQEIRRDDIVTALLEAYPVVSVEVRCEAVDVLLGAWSVL